MQSHSSTVSEDIEFFVFSPITADSALSRFSRQHGRDFVLRGYQDWLNAFSNRSDLFYRSQFDRVGRQVYEAFCRARGLDSSVDLYEQPDDYTDDYRAFRIGTAWEKLGMAMTSAKGMIEFMRQQYAPENWPYASWSGRDLFIAEMEGRVELPRQITAWLWEQWFSAVTDVPPEEREELVALPYAEYLRTPYWRRKRAAVLLARRLRCMSKHCDDGDSWLGWESDLHVHHLHYKTRGREQLSGLLLLCKQCHQRWHTGERDLVPYPNVDLTF